MPDASNIPEVDTGPRFRDLIEGDALDMVELAYRFFKESEFKEFTDFDPEAMFRTFDHSLRSPYTHFFVFEINGKIEGFIGYQIEQSYTTDPIGLMYLLYVAPEYRRSPVGRELVRLAENHAEAVGCKAFYAGSMSGIESVEKTLPNMFRKLGYSPLYWGTKRLNPEEKDVRG